MDKNEMLQVARYHMSWLKRQNIADKMKEKNFEELRVILKNIDYSYFRKALKPINFMVADFDLDGEQDLLAIVLYIWSNPYLRRGETDFFRDWRVFRMRLEKEAGEIGKNIAAFLMTEDLNELSLEELVRQ